MGQIKNIKLHIVTDIKSINIMVIKWLRSLLSSSRKLIGSDQLGNKYYEYPKAGGVIQRELESTSNLDDYVPGQIPTEWEAWLRRKREEPPTQEEIDKNLKRAALARQRGIIKEREDNERQEQAYRDGLITREPSLGDIAAKEALEHGPSPRIASSEGKPPHASEGSGYEPDSWAPGGDKDKVTEGLPEVEAWTPGGKT